MEIFASFSLEASHSLPCVSDHHKCRRLHGHSYRVEVHVRGPVPDETGWVMDFEDIVDAFQPVLGQLDHRHLNDVPGLENPTCENIARWIWERLKSSLPMLSKIVIHETPGSGCIYRGEDQPGIDD